MEGIDKSHPEVAAEWHPTLNGNLSPGDFSKGSDKVVYWLCSEGHSYSSRVKDRVKAKGCAVCNNRRIIPGVNDLASQYPEIAAQWHPTKNGTREPSQLLGSKKRVWWLCELGHEWQVGVWNRVYFKSGCPFCANQRAWPGFNDLSTTHPKVAAQWHPTKNKAVAPTQILSGSSTKFWWMCLSGHEWEAACSSRTISGVGCPVCSNKKIVSGINDLATLFPRISAQWDIEKNAPQTPREIAPATSKSFWWLCDEGHSWKTAVANRTRFDSKCPFCGGQKPILGKTDLESTHPNLASEWHPTRNGALRPADVMAGTQRKIWWMCDQGHEWSAPPFNRKKGVGCPNCAIYGYTPSENGYLYLLEKENESLQQFGITNNPKDRLRTHKKNGWHLLDVLGPADGYWIAETESAFKAYFRQKGLLMNRDRQLKFDGFTETWDSSNLRYKTIEQILGDLRNSEWGS